MSEMVESENAVLEGSYMYMPTWVAAHIIRFPPFWRRLPATIACFVKQVSRIFLSGLVASHVLLLTSYCTKEDAPDVTMSPRVD